MHCLNSERDSFANIDICSPIIEDGGSTVIEFPSAVASILEHPGLFLHPAPQQLSAGPVLQPSSADAHLPGEQDLSAGLQFIDSASPIEVLSVTDGASNIEVPF